MNFGDRIFWYLTRVFKKSVGSLLYIVIFAIGDLLQAFDTDFRQALLEASPITADGIWLDFWGFMFKLRRFHNEPDSTFRERMLGILGNGASTSQAILSAIRPYSTIEPTITEYSGGVAVNRSYDAYSYDTDYTKNAFIMQIQYRLEDRSDLEFYIDKSYITYSTGVVNTTVANMAANVIEQIVSDIKLAGVKVVFKQV
jgi:hypothetical protein